MRNIVRMAALLTVGGLVLNAANSAHGADADAAASGDWSAAGTWTPAEPAAGDAARINGGFTVGITQPGEAARLLDLGTISGQSGGLNVASGDLTVTGGALPSIRVGQAAGSTGTLAMNGGVVSIVSAQGGFAFGDLLVGDLGNGTMTMGGGTFNVADEVIVGLAAASQGTLNVGGGTMTTGPGGRSIIAGFFGNGAINLSGTANVTSRFDTIIAFDPGSTGALSIGDTAVLNANFLNTNQADFGAGNTATLTQTGGTINAGLAVVLGRGFGTTTFTHSAGAINVPTNNGDFVVSDGFNNAINTTTYNISGSATVTLLDEFLVGSGGRAVGIVNQTGGSISGQGVFVGARGTGTYNMNGGSLTSTAGTGAFDHLFVGFDGFGAFAGVGNLNQTAGAVTSAQSVFLGNFNDSNGTHRISGGSVNVAGSYSVGGALASNADPDATRTGTQGQAINVTGNLVVRGSAATINIGGDFLANPADKTIVGAVNVSNLTFEILSAAGTSLVNVGGEGDLDGAVIDVDALSFTPANGQVFNLIAALGGFGNTGVGTTQMTGTGEGFTSAADADSGNWTLRIVPGQSAGSEILQAVYAVPEPASLAAIAGFGAMLLRRRK